MIPNYELKLKARAALKNNWQTALLVALIASLPSLASQVLQLMNQQDMLTQLLLLTENSDALTVGQLTATLEGMGQQYLPTLLVGVLSLIVSPFLTLGLLHYFQRLLQGEKDVPVSAVFSRTGSFFRAIGLQLMMALRTFLWMLPGLAIATGGMIIMFLMEDGTLGMILTVFGYGVMMVLSIRAILHYAMATRYQAEDPRMGINKCIRESVNTMRSRKMLLFSLEISFFLYNIGLTILYNLLYGMVGNVIATTAQLVLSFALNVYVQMAVSAFYLAYRAPKAE